MSGRHVRRSKPRYVLILWIALFSILLFVSTYKVIAKTTTARQEQETFDTLAAMKEQSAQPESHTRIDTRFDFCTDCAARSRV